jgi:hypothetical protein
VPIAPLGLFYLQQVIAPEKSPSPTVESDLESWPGVAQLYALTIDKEAAHRVEQFGPSAVRGPENGVTLAAAPAAGRQEAAVLYARRHSTGTQPHT